MQCMQDRKNVGKVLLSPLKAPPAPEPKEEPKKAKEPEKQEEKVGEKVSRDRGMKCNDTALSVGKYRYPTFTEYILIHSQTST